MNVSFDVVDRPRIVYKEIRIELKPTELRSGGWTADFVLTECRGSEDVVTPYWGKEIYPTREAALKAGLLSARRTIEEKY